VNVFVGFENFLEELVAYNIWVLSSDHFGTTKFAYKFETETAQVGAVLGPYKEIAGQQFRWRPDGGNTLGVLLIYARLAADWMPSLVGMDKNALERPLDDYPHFADAPDRSFPFKHRALWADAQQGELLDFSEQFRDIVGKLERSRMAEVRNGLDHYREPDKFPSIEIMLACHNWLSAVFEFSDERRFIPKAFWQSRENTDEYGMLGRTVEDYARRKIEIDGPALLSGLPEPDFFRPILIPYGNLLGDSSLIFYLTEESEYSRMWENYPRRQKVPISRELDNL
jgi:hypothetical protein